MRTIKYRCWHKKTKKMYEVRDLIITPSGQVWVDAINEYKDGKFDKANRNLEWGYDVSVELMQFCGLKDKNGKEIFEGDILIWKDWEQEGQEEADYYLVVYQAPSFLTVCYRDGEVLAGEDALLSGSEDFILHGNIYENPELLK